MANAASSGPAPNLEAEAATSGDMVVQMPAPAPTSEVWKQLNRLSEMVFWIGLVEWAGNAVGTLAFLWATVVMLGGFSTMLSPMDFWFSAVMVFIEGTRVFIRSDASVNQWLFGSTRAFKWDDFSFRRVPKFGIGVFAMITSGSITLIPLDFEPEIAAGILKVALLVIFSQVLIGRWRNSMFVRVVIVAGFGGTLYGFYKVVPHKPTSKSKGAHILANLKPLGLFFGWYIGSALAVLTTSFGVVYFQSLRKPLLGLVLSKFISASGLVCLPILQGKLGSTYRYFIISIGAVLLSFGCPPDNRYWTTREENNNTLLLGTRELLTGIFDTLLIIIFFWSVVFPLPGVPLKISVFMLFSVLAAAIVGNLQLPVAFLQVVLSSLRLHSFIGHHHRAYDYDPLPDGASTNLVPSIVVFYVLELCQGSAYMVGIVLGIFSFRRRRSLVRALEFEKEWGAKAVNLYEHHVYQARTSKGLFPAEKYRPPSIHSFAIDSLGSTSSEMQIVRIHVLDHYLRHKGSEQKKKLITEMAKDATHSIAKTIGIISSLITDLSENNNGEEDEQEQQVVSSIWIKIFHSVLRGESAEFREAERREVLRSSLCLSVKFLSSLATTTAGKIGARFRQELADNPLFLNSLERILDLKDSGLELSLEPVMMDLIATLALDEAMREEIWSRQVIIGRLMDAFLRPQSHDANKRYNNDEILLVRKAAGGALANLTIMSTDNCWAILKDTEHHLISNLITMFDHEDECLSCIAANLLHNLCANSGDMLIDLGVKEEELESSLPKVIKAIKTKEGKQLEATLCAATQIGYVIPEYFAKVLGTDAAALVKKLVDTLRSNVNPSHEYPRIRRALIELVISIVRVCPDPYKRIFREQRMKDALDMLKGTSPRLEKHMVFIGGEGIGPESSPLRDLVEEAKRLFIIDNEATPTQGAQ